MVETTFTTTGTTLGRLTGKSNPLRANSANAKQPPCHDPSPWKKDNFHIKNVKLKQMKGHENEMCWALKVIITCVNILYK